MSWGASSHFHSRHMGRIRYSLDLDIFGLDILALSFSFLFSFLFYR